MAFENIDWFKVWVVVCMLLAAYCAHCQQQVNKSGMEWFKDLDRRLNKLEDTDKDAIE